MADVVSLRTEIKAWERDFKSKFSRDPSVQDIKDQPAIADKYKLYKKLSKAVAAAACLSQTRPSSSQTPTTPPKSTAHPSRSHIISKPREIEVVAPLPGFNPFSPVKNKGKQRDSPPASSFSTRKAHLPNSFATPSKNIPNCSSRSESPDNFPEGQPYVPIGISLSSQLPPAPNTAVSRARKRLRGEPVSPSPNKQKRQRIGSHSALPFRLSHSLSSDDESDEIMGGTDVNISFVDDSPIKLPAGGKSFRLLFEDTLPTASVPKRPANVSKSQSRGSNDAVISHGVDSNDATSLEAFPANAHKDSRRSNNCQDKQKSRTDAKPTLISKIIKKDEFPNAEGRVNQSRSGSSRTIAVEKRAHGKSQEPKSSLKRVLEAVSVNDGLSSASFPQFPLLPPSPTSEEASSNRRVPANGKGMAGTSRKKAKVVDEEDEEEDDDDLDEVAVKVINRTQTAQQVSENADKLDWDPILHSGARDRDQSAAAGDTSCDENGTFRVDLPDELRLMLAISPSRTHNSKEERVFRGLLYGDRVGHYDASRGGDIWDIGEAEDDTRGSTEGEDDWEGEPIPWEVGEL
ncbi:uncharacterized protein BJ212DRAFT_1295102 [Suillus subaureus]|uniref:DNA replication regulator SLD2 n=1 Tax=Suillus subaureus TaxID=48587 RepID=A0A9P7EMZ9_9AGAM|nr:uncharacterized protein BJ212DRAFT_1295102 [Suillus subaureus]KAG1825729.1 hypothetical protein BJ212DRAFT_1295102 [Suillus subaureus]